MEKRNLSNLTTIPALIFSLAWVNLPSTVIQVYAQPAVIENSMENEKIIFQGVTSSPNEEGPTGTGSGAGSHSGDCKVGDQQTPLIALMPSETTVSGEDVAVWGRTTEEFPTLWFYAAFPTNSYVMFRLQDKEENTVYSTSFQLQRKDEETPGIVSVTIPPTDQFSLKAGEKYLWYFYIMCEQPNSPDDFVSGWVEVAETTTELERQLQQAETPLDRVKLYAENGFWLPTLTSLDKLRSDESQNQQVVEQIWSNLLQQVGLEEVNQIPVVQRYIPQIEEE